MKEVMNKLLSDASQASDLIDKLEDLLFSIKFDIENHALMDNDEYVSCDHIRDAVFNSIKDYELNINEINDCNYSDNPEKRKAFYIGVISGYRSALFWICDDLNLITFFENKVSPILDKYINKITDENT